MNEIKGLLWYIMSQTTLIFSVLLLMIGINIKIVYVILGFAGLDLLFGFLYYFGIMEKIRSKK
jgi:hypothetical protein